MPDSVLVEVVSDKDWLDRTARQKAARLERHQRLPIASGSLGEDKEVPPGLLTANPAFDFRLAPLSALLAVP